MCIELNTERIHAFVENEGISISICRDSGSVSTHVISSKALKTLYRTNIHTCNLDLSIMATNCPNNILVLTVHGNCNMAAVRVTLDAQELCSFAVIGRNGEKCTSCFEGIVHDTENVIVKFD